VLLVVDRALGRLVRRRQEDDQRLRPGAGAGLDRVDQVAALVDVDLVDHAAGDVQAVRSLGDLREDPEDPAELVVGHDVRESPHPAPRVRRGEEHLLRVVEYPPRLHLVAGGRVDLGADLAVGQQQQVAHTGGDRRLARLARHLEPDRPDDPDDLVDLVVEAHPAEDRGDEPDDLPRVETLAELERFAGPAALRVPERRQALKCLAHALDVEVRAFGLIGLERDDQRRPATAVLDLLRPQAELEQRLVRNGESTLSRRGLRRHRRRPSVA
jgi:hypothetical protein